jgi:hypothetical protein
MVHGSMASQTVPAMTVCKRTAKKPAELSVGTGDRGSVEGHISSID